MAERTFVRNPARPFVASQSSLKVSSDCERKFAHQYVWRTPNDSDYEEPLYYRFGRGFHEIMEHTDGHAGKLRPELLEGIAMSHRLDWEKDIPKLEAMVRAYDRHRALEEVILAREVEVVGEDWVLYADAISEMAGQWWIIDYKSIGVALDPLIRPKLRHDPQVCLYVAHREQLAKSLGLDPAKFGGFSYREIEKPRERQKKNETREQFVARMVPNCRTTTLTLADLAVEEVMKQLFLRLLSARDLFNDPETTVQNRTKCVEKGSRCQFWSQCNGGMTYTEAKASIAEDCDKF